MKSWILAAMATSMVWCGLCGATVSIVKNGSFENDGLIDYVTPDDRPQYWCDVSNDASRFAAYIGHDWATDSNYSLTMYTNMFTTFEPNDAVTVSQSVFLTNANALAFDVHLATTFGEPWDPEAVTARVLIDDYEIWNSDGLVFTAGQFEGRVVVEINEIFKDENPHVLSLQLRTDVSNLNLVQYFSQWDFVGFANPCGGPGNLPADLTGDCVVDINDLKIFTDGWLDPAGHDLTGDHNVDFIDFAVLADSWQVSGDSNSLPPPQDNLLEADLNDDGIVDYGDLFDLSRDWLINGGPCVRADLNGDGAVNFVDYTILVQSWMLTGSLYGWQ